MTSLLAAFLETDDAEGRSRTPIKDAAIYVAVKASQVVTAPVDFYKAVRNSRAQARNAALKGAARTGPVGPKK